MTMYPTVRPSLTLDFQKSKQLDPRISFSRPSSATYVEGGVIKYADEHQARFEEQGLLIEESRTNFEPSSDLSTGWSFSPAQGSNSTAPDGSNNAVELNGGSAGGTGNILVAKNITLTTAGAYVLSFFVKKPTDSIAAFTYLEARFFAGSSNGVKLFFDWSTNDWSSYSQINGSDYILPVKEYANGWFRLSIKFTPVSSDLSGSIRTGISDQAGNASVGTWSTDNKILVWGAQIEEGSFPTSYIPTAGSTVTRSADVLQITGDNFSSWYNQSEGTITYKYTAIGGNQFLSPASIRAGNAQDSQSWGYWMYTGGSQYRVPFAGQRKSPNEAVYLDGAFTSTVMGQSYKVAVSQDNSTLSGVLQGYSTNSISITSLPTMTELGIGYVKNNGNNKFTGHISRLSYYPERLTDTQLEVLTS